MTAIRRQHGLRPPARLTTSVLFWLSTSLPRYVAFRFIPETSDQLRQTYIVQLSKRSIGNECLRCPSLLSPIGGAPLLNNPAIRIESHSLPVLPPQNM